MEPFFSGNKVILARAITNSEVHLIAYWLIIGGELITGAVCMVGATFAILLTAIFVALPYLRIEKE